MSLVVTKSGILDTVQDLGRHGHRRFGINPNGAMDRTALRVANLVLGNPENTAALEIHFPAPELKFRKRISFAVTGADFSSELDETQVDDWRPQTANRGSVLRFRRPLSGRRAYLAVRNGFELTEWLSSMSTNLVARAGGYKGRNLKQGDAIRFANPEKVARRSMSGFRQYFARDPVLRFLPGPDFRDITAVSELALRKKSFRISPVSNRMGYRLDGPLIHLLDTRERLSSSVTFGTIQVLPGGQLIVLMADHQTSGGYPNIGTIIGPDLPRAAQLGPGDFLRFEPVTAAEAESALCRHEQGFSMLRHGLRLGRG